MSKWPRYPRVFEISTWVWLAGIREKYGAAVDLRSVPAAEWDSIAEYGFDAVWLMGVWERSPAGTAIANRNQDLLDDFRRALPDFEPRDNVGSPYCVRRYAADPFLGGPAGLAAARAELAKRGLRLILDFVPNHVAPDHPWALEHPEYFIRGTTEDACNDPASYLEVNGQVIACGRDPYFPAWPDVLQLNAFDPGLRIAVKKTLSEIAGQCDGVRCDMAMLFLNSVFDRTWAVRAGQRPQTEYWEDLIPAIKQAHPDFLFVAEAYWDLEWDLQQQGFDFCYDKKLYDRMEHESPESIRLHLCADLAYQAKLLRFLENHDEPRAAATFSPGKERAAAVAITTLPGATLFYEGQLAGRKVRLPVFLARRPEEVVDSALETFYRKLLKATDRAAFREGEWRLCERTGWPDNPSFQNLLCWNWVKGEERYLIAVNFSERPVQARVRVPWTGMKGETLRLVDRLSDAVFERSGDEMTGDGFYVALGPWAYHFFECRQIVRPAMAAAA